MQNHGNGPTRSGMLLQHLIVFLICVVFPGGVTLMASATWLTFERSGEVVGNVGRCQGNVGRCQVRMVGYDLTIALGHETNFLVYFHNLPTS